MKHPHKLRLKMMQSAIHKDLHNLISFLSVLFGFWTSPRLRRLIGVSVGPIPPPFPSGKGASRLIILLILQVNALFQEVLASPRLRRLIGVSVGPSPSGRGNQSGTMTIA